MLLHDPFEEFPRAASFFTDKNRQVIEIPGRLNGLVGPFIFRRRNECQPVRQDRDSRQMGRRKAPFDESQVELILQEQLFQFFCIMDG